MVSTENESVRCQGELYPPRIEVIMGAQLYSFEIERIGSWWLVSILVRSHNPRVDRNYGKIMVNPKIARWPADGTR